MFWVNLAFYDTVWFTSVAGAEHGQSWPAMTGAMLFGVWRLAVSPDARTECRLVVVALLFGSLCDGALAHTGWVVYAAPSSWDMAPLWILALWAAFALSVVPLFGYLHTRPWLAAAVGAIGGPLAYLGAARGWHAVQFSPPVWHALGALTLGWGVAMPLLTALAHHGIHVRGMSARSAL